MTIEKSFIHEKDKGKLSFLFFLLLSRDLTRDDFSAREKKNKNFFLIYFYIDEIYFTTIIWNR